MFAVPWHIALQKQSRLVLVWLIYKAQKETKSPGGEVRIQPAGKRILNYLKACRYNGILLPEKQLPSARLSREILD